MNRIVEIPEKINYKLKFINTILFSMYGIKIIHNKNSNTYKLSNNNVWNNLPNDIESKVLELKNSLEDNIDNIDTSELDIIIQ
jgi:hypothetical protein